MVLGNTLVIRPGALGDAVLTLPLLHALRAAGATRLAVLGTQASWTFLSNVEHLRILEFSSIDWLGLFSRGASFGPQAREILGQTQTALIYLSGDTSDLQAALLASGVQRILISDPPQLGEQSESRGVEGPLLSVPPDHAARRLLEPLRDLVPDAILNAALQLDSSVCFFETIDHAEIKSSQQAVNWHAQRSVIALHPGSGGLKKCWPAENFAGLAAALSKQYTPLVLFGPADEKVRHAFNDTLPEHTEYLCANGLDLRGVRVLLSQCSAYVGNDSGITHLAARVCPTLAIFGPTQPEIWAPLGAAVRIVRAPGGALDKVSIDHVLSELHRLPITGASNGAAANASRVSS